MNMNIQQIAAICIIAVFIFQLCVGINNIVKVANLAVQETSNAS